MKRFYEKILEEHFAHSREAIFLSGPRQVGKTTIAQHLEPFFDHSQSLNWDYGPDQNAILSHDIDILKKRYLGKNLLIFDEIHKFKEWKNYLKGLFDKYKESVRFLVTGSSRLNVYRRGGDSMMGRYFLYRIHPLTVAELIGRSDFSKEIVLPQALDDDKWRALIRFGGFPKPFLENETRAYNRWKNQRLERLFEEDICDVLRIHEASKMQLLAKVLQEQSGQQLSYTNLSNKIQVSDQTIRSWISHLEAFYYCFRIQPWSKNITRSLIKEPKLYLWDWSLVSDEGKRHENLIASHLLKAVHFWTDDGLGVFDLFYLRDKEKREVDFLVTKDDKPFMMVEVKTSQKESLSKSLFHFQEQLQVAYLFQVAIDAPYLEEDCFKRLREPCLVPARTFLSQLI